MVQPNIYKISKFRKCWEKLKLRDLCKLCVKQINGVKIFFKTLKTNALWILFLD